MPTATLPCCGPTSDASGTKAHRRSSLCSLLQVPSPRGRPRSEPPTSSPSTTTPACTVIAGGATLPSGGFSDEDGHRYRFDDVRLAGRATVRIRIGVGRDTRTYLYQDRRNYVWDNRSDTAILRDDRGRTVDTESWGRGHHRR
ncbi:lamin tail domain-containing protein [Streptomyces sp. NPDC005571]|uniref:lamin tail domain-containing protein n=1 Tax=Streptomyces sp. NPDC005571 TaxID=3156888 RepID=UPI0033AFDEB9